MKKIFYFLLLITGFVNAQIVNIPDANFKAKLLAADVTNNIASNGSANIKIDVNNDNEIQVSEALAVTKLIIPVSNILDLTGIQTFINLDYLDCSNQSNGFGPSLNSLNLNGLSSLSYLDCSNNPIVSLDVTFLTSLNVLKCNYNELSSLNVNSLVNLTELEFAHNHITNIDLAENTNLLSLSCYSNQLTDIDLNSLNDLVYLYCGENPLNTLNVSNLSNLVSLGCNQNGLTSIDISNLVNLRYFNCDDNQISTLDLQNQIFLTILNCNSNLISSIDLSNAASDGSNFGLQFGNNPNLTYINLKNSGNLIGFYPTNCPNLTFICINDDDFSFVNQELLNYGITGVIFNSYCSFTPGGNYNTITGSITFDEDNDGCDVFDLPQPNIRIDINDGTNQGATFTNNSGNYNFYTQAGSFVLTPNIENPTWFTISPTTATIPFANNNNNTTTQNFCISANGIHPDLEIVIAPITPARPGFDAVYQIVYKNKGNQTLSQLYGVNFFFNQNLMDFVSATTAPATIGSGSLSWSYANLLPFESRSIYVTLNINTPTDVNYPVNIGDVLQFTTSILPIAGDETTTDNTFSYNQTVVDSYDPNDITCIEGPSVSPSLIGEYLHYVINFENTGTAAAENVVVKATIDTTKFNLNSLQLLNTSHPSYVKITGNIVEFIFENIALDTGGHGNILLKIRSNGTLQSGDNVSNRGDIFFDYNAPIDTGIANTVFQSLNNNAFEKDNSVVIFPNPTQSIINIKSDNSIKSIQLYDVQGRLLQTKLTEENSTSIDISDKSNGIYFLKITSDKGIKVERLVKE